MPSCRQKEYDTEIELNRPHDKDTIREADMEADTVKNGVILSTRTTGVTPGPGLGTVWESINTKTFAI